MMILIKTRLQSASACPVEGIKRHLPNMEYQPLIATGLRASETVAEPEGKTFIVDRKKIDTDLELNTITWRRIVLRYSVLTPPVIGVRKPSVHLAMLWTLFS